MWYMVFSLFILCAVCVYVAKSCASLIRVIYTKTLFYPFSLYNLKFVNTLIPRLSQNLWVVGLVQFELCNTD